MAYKLDEKGNIVSDDAYKGIVASAGNFGTVKNTAGQVLTGLDSSGELVFGSAAPISRYTSPGAGSVPSPLTPVGGPRGEAGSAFSEGGALGERAPYTPAEEDKVRQDAADRVRSQVDAITQSALLVRNAAIKSGIGNLGRARASASATGMLGSPIGDTQESEVEAINNEKLAVIEAKKNADISAILNGANEKADAAIAARKNAAATNEKSYLDYLSGLATNANNQIITLAKAGSSYDDLAKKDSVGLQNLLDQAGISAEGAKAIMIANAPAGTYINGDKPQISADGKTATFFKQSRGPDGKAIITAENIELPVSAGTDPKNIDIVSRDDGIYILNKADGTFKKVGEASAAMVNAQNKGAEGGGDNEQLYSGLSTKTATAVRGKVGKYSGEGNITNFSTVQDGYNFSKSIDTKTKNPADDQALIYALAKALDPGSVVREGEYKTAQMYAQSWVDAYGKGVTQALLGTGFLSEKARSNIKKVIEQKYLSQKSSYDQTKKSYVAGINALTGRSDGEKFLVDYVTPEEDAGDTGGTTEMTGPDGKVWEVPNDQVETFRENGYN